MLLFWEHKKGERRLSPHTNLYINPHPTEIIMKILLKNLHEGIVKLRITSLDDIWYLSHIIEEGDLVRGRTTRKIKIGEDSVKKSYFMEIKTEKTEYSETTLRVSGTITEGPEEVALGVHQSFSLQEGDEITIKKNKWPVHILDKLHEAEKEKSDILICTVDREGASIAILKPKGYQIISTLKGNAEKKAYKSETKDFFAEFVSKLSEYVQKYKSSKAVIASPAIWHKNIKEKLDSEMNKLCTVIDAGGGENSIEEVLKSENLVRILKDERITKEINLVETLLKEISVSGKSEYGLKYVASAVNAGAVEVLLVTDKFLHKKRQSNTFQEIDDLMKNTEKMNGKIFIISTDHEAGKKLEGIGGIGAILRYKIR